MNGSVISETPIAIDFWQRTKCPQSKVFFLSHAHSDHTTGLSSTWRQPIYCSEVTGKMAVAKCGVKESLIRPLPVGECHIIPLDENGKETMTVTVLDANHCPGATMFLFEGYFGRILYTGDFRYQPSMVTNTILKERPSIDRLYLDNTYNVLSCEFPSEIDCKMEIMEILAQHPNVDVVIGLHQLGKEDLLVDIANFFEEEIQVTPERLSWIDHVDCEHVFTTEPRRIRVVPVHTITLWSVERWNSEIPTIVIIPSAVFRAHRKSHLQKHPRVFIIPYSNHSSYSELIQFVRQLRPRKVLPIVRPTPSKAEECKIADMSNFEHFLDPTPATAFSIPTSVKDYMKSSSENAFAVFQARKRRLPMKAKRVAAKGVVFNEDSDDIDGNKNLMSLSAELNENNLGPSEETLKMSHRQDMHLRAKTVEKKSPLKKSKERENGTSDRTFHEIIAHCAFSIEKDISEKSPSKEGTHPKETFQGVHIIATNNRKDDYQLDFYKAIHNFHKAADQTRISCQ